MPLVRSLLLNFEKEVYMLRREVYVIVANISEVSKVFREELIRNSIPVLMKDIWYKEKEQSLRKEIAKSFFNLSKNDSIEVENYILSIGVIDIIFESFMLNDIGVTNCALDSLINLIKFDLNYSNGQELCQIIKSNQEYFPILEKQKLHPYEGIKRKVSFA